MRCKFSPVDLNIVRNVKNLLDNLKRKQSSKKNELLLKIYEKYPDNAGSVGIDIYEEDKDELIKQLEIFTQSELQAEMSEDVKALEKLLTSDEWAVFLKYAGKLDFDLSGCSSFTEKMAFQNAKESAVNTALSVPQTIIDFYNQGVKNYDN